MPRKWGIDVGRGPVRVVLAGDVARIRGIAGAAPGVVVVGETEDVLDMYAMVLAGRADVVLLIGVARRLTTTFVNELLAAETAVVGWVTGEDSDEAALFERVGVISVIGPASSPSDVAGMLVRASERVRMGYHRRGAQLAQAVTRKHSAQPTLPGAPGRIVAVWGPAGAPGRSMVAGGLAETFAGRGVRSLLIDADTYGGAQAALLSLVDDVPGLLTAARAAERGLLTPDVLRRLTLPVASGLRVLTGDEGTERWSQVSGSAFRRVLENARGMAQVTVIDCGFSLEDDPELSYDAAAPRRNAVTLAALEAADDVVAVGRDDVVGLRRLEAGLLELGRMDVAPTLVVVNHTPGTRGRPAKGAEAAAPTEGDAARHHRAGSWRRLRAEHRVFGFPSIPAAVAQAQARGATVAGLPDSSPLSTGLIMLSLALVPVPASV